MLTGKVNISERDAFNIQAFNWLTLRIFDELYECFPETKDFDGLHFVISTIFDVGPKSRQVDYLPHFSATMRWLRDEGFLRYESEEEGVFRKVVLTLRGLTVLGYLPTSLGFKDKKEPIIVKIRRVIGKGVEGAASDGVKVLIMRIFELIN
ncbi:hypothetical protein [Permianibacter aggregans]|uniref:hypothetical protein n=1 Tax=Permianibacter aggregans TaxID=1510150 RepID=UPI0010617F35|nr:hypothetical protein [Permianibacter aggregans]QGX38244.1 hypothetical protein E2H98_00580 [Permianibacter aggregans]